MHTIPKPILVVDYTHPDHPSQQQLFTHLQHLLNDIPPNSLTIHVVVYGEGINILTTGSSARQDNIARLQDAGIIFIACHNAMKKHHLTPSDLLADTQVVPSGIGYLVTMQLNGAVYLKA